MVVLELFMHLGGDLTQNVQCPNTSGLHGRTDLLRGFPVPYPDIRKEGLCTQLLVGRLLFVRVVVHCNHVHV